VLVFPNNVKFSSITPRLVTRTIVNETQSFKQIKSKLPGHRWEFTLKTEAMDDNKSRGLFGFISSLEGRFNPFQVKLPIYSDSRGVALFAKVNGALSAGTKTITVDGLAANQPGSVMAGDFISFANHSKVYQVAIDADSNASGQATLTLAAPLLNAVPNDTNVNTKNVLFTVALSRDIQKFTKKGGLLTRFEFDCEEVF